MLVIAHRGFSSQYTANTIIAFQQALILDVDAIELDIHQVEHEFLVFHDPYVNELTNAKGRIFDMPLIQARQLLVKSVIATHRCKVVISSFDHPLLMAIKSSFSDFIEAQFSSDDTYPVEFGALIAHAPFDHAKYASNLGVLIAATDCNTVNADFVEDAHKRGKKVWCYTVNHPETLTELLEIGVDGIFTDRPDWAKQFIMDRGSISQTSP
jgi:glycerophosphoryl diester phosphodiesterase